MTAAKKERYKPRLRQRYEETLRAALTQKFGYKNALEVPRLDK